MRSLLQRRGFMLRNTILCLCLIAAPGLHAESYEPTPESITEKKCDENENKDRLTWKKFFLGAGVFVIGVATFILVGVKNNK